MDYYVVLPKGVCNEGSKHQISFQGGASLFPASGSRGFAGQVVEHPGYAWHSANLAHLEKLVKCYLVDCS